MAKIVSPLTGTLKSIKSQFISKEKLLKSSLKVQQKRIESKRKNSERERFINYEKVLERPLAVLGKPLKSVTKRLGFLDALKNFIVNVLLGFFALRLLKYLPQLKEVFITILKAGNFIIEISGKILDGLVTFVDRGYAAYDHARKIVGKIGGEAAIQSMDKLSSQMNSVMNSIFIAGMLFTDFGGVGQGGGVAKKAIDASVDTVKNVLTEQAGQQVAKQAARAAVGPLGAAGIVLGTGLLASAIGEGAFQVKKLGKGLQGWLSGKMNEASQDKNPLTRFLKKGFFGWLNASLGPALWILNGTGVLFDIVGAPFRYGVELIRAAFMKLNDDAKGLTQQRKNLGKFDARIRDGIREHFSILSPLFKFMGMKGVSQKLETPGSFGSLYGEQAVKDMGYYGGGKVKVRKYASGGPVSIQRTEVKDVDIPRTPPLKEEQIDPGSSVGGGMSFVKVFPNPMDDPRLMNKYDYIINAHKTIRGINYIGPVMALASKALIGDTITKNDYDIAANQLSSLMLMGLYEQNPSAYQQFSSLIKVGDFNRSLSQFLFKNMKEPVAGILNLLRAQVKLEPIPLPSGPSGGSGDDCPCPEGSDGQFVATGNVYERALLETISQVEGTAGPDGYRTMFGGGKFQAPPWRHPDTVVRSGGYASAAAGKYQFMPGTWAENSRKVGATDFSPANQDKVALFMIRSRHSLDPSKQLTVDQLGKLGTTWAGLTPHYGQTNRTKEQSYSIYTKKLQELGATPSSSMAKIAPGSPAANVDDCVCDPETPTGDPGDVQAAGATAGGNISGYPVTSEYGMRKHPIYGGMKMHGGVDISGMKSGAPYALNVPGVAGPPPQYEGGYGNFIDIQIPSLGNLYFRFAHMSKPPNYKPGQQIPAGKIFGYAGTTGASTGVHLHFEVNKELSGYGGDRDPMPYGKYISIGRESGGPKFSGGIRLLHKGEYVIDKDSVDLLGGVSFYHMINGVENKKQRAQKSSSLIQHLSKYTGRKIDQRPTVIVESPEDIIVPSPPIYVSSGSGGSGSSGGESDWEYDNLELR